MAKLYRLFTPLVIAALSLGVTLPGQARAELEITGYKLTLAEAAAEHPQVAQFYRENGYAPIWTRPEDAPRRQALLNALARAADHALPVDRYRPAALMDILSAAETDQDLARAEVAISALFLSYAHDVHAGILEPVKIDDGILRELPRLDGAQALTAVAGATPALYIASLPPRGPAYVGLMKEKRRLENVIAYGGWGPTLRSRKLEPGDTGRDVVALRNRLIRMGYLDRSLAAGYDADLETAVRGFQSDHGLAVDGVAGTGTIKHINISAQARLKQVLVGIERARWRNIPLGPRHIMVNIPDFHAYVIDDGKASFTTRVVVGKNIPDQRTPEFSDTMEHMIINPTWNVPRSIATKEYLPQLKANPYAVSYLNLVDGQGRVVNRSSIDFSKFSARNFPFDIKQPPSSSNALGLVKFMFPNTNNIYLHDTPSKSLFKRDVRAYSHGCVRVARPFDLAYHLLEPQEDTPKDFFQATLKTGRETQVDLKTQIPVHITYQTVWVPVGGRPQYRADIYGRDARLWDALARTGLALPALDG